jgi:uncharacterized integral membrane protein
VADDPVEQERGWSEFRDGKPARERDRDVGPRLVVALLALIAAVIFIAQNRNRVETTFLFFEGHPRLWVVILASLALGALLGQAAALLRRRRRSDRS